MEASIHSSLCPCIIPIMPLKHIISSTFTLLSASPTHHVCAPNNTDGTIISSQIHLFAPRPNQLFLSWHFKVPHAIFFARVLSPTSLSHRQFLFTLPHTS